MSTVSLETLKTIIEINSDIHSDYSNQDALLFRILKSAMRLVKCEICSFVRQDRRTGQLRLVAEWDGRSEKNCDVLLDTKSVASQVVSESRCLVVNGIDEDLFYYSLFKDRFPGGVSTVLAHPVSGSGRCFGVLELFNKNGGAQFNETDMFAIRLVSDIAAAACGTAEKLLSLDERIAALKQNASLNPSASVRLHHFIAESPVIKDLMVIVKKAAAVNSSVLLTGESGVGKELFAEQIYLNSRRADKPFVRVNCAALSGTLMESELFGHIRGAYTSADSTQKGRFEMADGGTIFLDEVGEIPLALQPKLLRVIQDKQFERVGSSETVSVDVRIIAATNRNLGEMVQQGTFREDLFFRLNVLPIRIPPLRARTEDIFPLAMSFLQKYSGEVGKSYTGFSDAALSAMKEYSWPGNVRELENAIARACIIGNEPVIQRADLRLSAESVPAGAPQEQSADEFAGVVAAQRDGDRTLKAALTRFKRAYIVRILEECSWNQTKAGKLLGIQRTYVSRLLNELDIRDDRRS